MLYLKYLKYLIESKKYIDGASEYVKSISDDDIMKEIDKMSTIYIKLRIPKEYKYQFSLMSEDEKSILIIHRNLLTKYIIFKCVHEYSKKQDKEELLKNLYMSRFLTSLIYSYFYVKTDKNIVKSIKKTFNYMYENEKLINYIDPGILYVTYKNICNSIPQHLFYDIDMIRMNSEYHTQYLFKLNRLYTEVISKL